jgi:excisionase family DNA binding protein
MREPLTIEQAAQRLNISLATARRWAASGRIPAEKSGKQWLVDGDQLAGRGQASKGDRWANEVSTALTYVQSRDLVDVPVPDILRCADELRDRDAVLAGSRARLEEKAPRPAVEVYVDKGTVFTRRMTNLQMEDRIAFQAAVGSFADRIEARTSSAVFSARLSEHPEYFTKRSSDQWVKWRAATLKQLGPGNEWLVETDLSSYFDTIRHRQLISDIEALNVDPETVAAIREMLRKWAHTEGLGLPQGPDASRVLGNLFLLPVDDAMLNAEWRYSRFMDDVQIVAESKPAAIQAMRQFQQECNVRGLIVSSAKTKLLFGKEARASLEESRRLASIEYLMQANVASLARPELRAVLKDALEGDLAVKTRDAKFSLYRLGQLHDDGVLDEVLSRLEDLAPIASVVAAYLPPFLEDPRVVDSLAQFLHDPMRSYSAHLSTWLFAVMLEHPGNLPESWVDVAAKRMQDRNQPVYLRSVATVVAGRGRRPAHTAWMKREVLREHDPAVLRGLAVGLYWADQLDRVTQRELLAQSPHLQKTISYLQGRARVPSLVFRKRFLKVRRS